MPSYTYRAVDPNGCIVEGSLDASSERALETQLRQSDVELLRCAEARARRFGRKGRVARKDLIGFCFHMEQMTRAGLPIIEALADLRDSVGHPVFAEVIANLISSVEVGNTLSQAMAEFPQVFDDVFVNLIAVGEESGELPEVLLKLTDSLKWQDEIMAKAKTVIIYPAFVGVVVVGVMLFMMLFVVPQMVDFIREMGQDLPLHTLALIGFSNFLVNHWWWAVPLPAVILMLIRFQARRDEGFRYIVDGWKLRAWYIGPVLSKIVLSRFASYFALCYSAGLDVIASLRISEDIAGNAVIRKGIQRIAAGITDGKSLSDAIESTELFPPLVTRMVRMGESTGLLDEALHNVSYFYDREVTESIDRLKAMIEPAMTVVLGGIMGWIMLSVLGPIYETISQIGI
ncbi:MAG: type II secretion system F family protein [Gammaproteobacteria bacterium]|nr:type II secretion system F family protein [Gammaproteobacteria bacterium]